ncbi:MAG TPA: DinB family protein [Bacteroidota bacterium]|nr:DinB family protein [Bacteroidota bacterium]
MTTGAINPAADTGAAYLAYCRRRLSEEYLPRILRCLEELTDEEIWWRPHENGNSAGNLVLHLAGNVGQWINSGLGGTPDNRNRNGEFSERGPVSRKELVERLVTTLSAADATLARFDASRLLEKRNFQVYEATCLDAVSHVVEHFAQHLGQIIYITKLRRGVDLKFYDL